MLVTSIQWIRPPGFPKERLEKIKNECWKDVANARDWKENFSDSEHGESDIDRWESHHVKDIQETSFVEESQSGPSEELSWSSVSESEDQKEEKKKKKASTDDRQKGEVG